MEEVLYPAMEDYALDIIVGKGPAARSIRLKLPRFTVIGATTRMALISAPLRARFGAVYRLNYYDLAAMESIINRAAVRLGVAAEPAGIKEIARRARGTPARGAAPAAPRRAIMPRSKPKRSYLAQVAKDALKLLEVDERGLDDGDRRLLLAIIEKYSGGTGRPEHHRRFDQRRTGYDHGCGRALPAPARFSRTHPARADRHPPGL